MFLNFMIFRNVPKSVISNKYMGKFYQLVIYGNFPDMRKDQKCPQTRIDVDQMSTFSLVICLEY